jgi:hypothetical protein
LYTHIYILFSKMLHKSKNARYPMAAQNGLVVPVNARYEDFLFIRLTYPANIRRSRSSVVDYTLHQDEYSCDLQDALEEWSDSE